MTTPKFSRGATIYPNLAALDESMPHGHTWGVVRKDYGWCAKEERVAGPVKVARVLRGGSNGLGEPKYELDFGGRKTQYGQGWVEKHFATEATHVKNLLRLAAGDDRLPAVIHARNQLMDIADRLTNEVSAIRETPYKSAFEVLLAAWGDHKYRPTLSVRNPAQKALADIYDFVQAARGVSVVVFRSHG